MSECDGEIYHYGRVPGDIQLGERVGGSHGWFEGNDLQLRNDWVECIDEMIHALNGCIEDVGCTIDVLQVKQPLVN